MHTGSSGAWDEKKKQTLQTMCIILVLLLILWKIKTTALYHAESSSAIEVSRFIFVDNQSCLPT